jgi:hypothetical protein
MRKVPPYAAGVEEEPARLCARGGSGSTDLRTCGVPAHADLGRRGCCRQPPREFQTAVNLIVVKQLNLAIPESVPQRAAFVYQAEK